MCIVTKARESYRHTLVYQVMLSNLKRSIGGGEVERDGGATFVVVVVVEERERERDCGL